MNKAIENAQNIHDLRALARKRAYKMVFDYIDGGADDEKTLKHNSTAFDEYRLAYKVLAGVDKIDMSTSLLGTKIDVPFFCSPSAGNRLFHTAGENAVAKAAGKIGTIYSLSTLSSVSIEDIAALTDGPKWFQLYVWKDRALVKEMINRAKAAGYTALILTVDLPVHGNRERDPKNGFTIPPTIGVKQIWEAIKSPAWVWDYLTGEPIKYANINSDLEATSLIDFIGAQLHAGFTWDDAEWLLGEWNGPAVIKGVVRTDDARRAVKTGFNAVTISNHGGRQLDHSPAPIEVLEDIVQTVGSDAEVILDGGVRRATDILKALALGAKAVSFARPYLYGLAAGGEAGVDKALDLFITSLKRDMALLGARSINEIDQSFICGKR
ncbi:alpha-hydroxy acid oxidase [Kordiimonas sp. SCSIO 12610]|uniref:alpha-hydroxy acid oxidase n=1 Tax=Kordiimonas sp. SCSIO 12610 TaxID=2829597 RepID=UPI002109168F|nr:alpha-hydroxy acid oxidase [Kordiimonas sp. SCSIO 12610]UTW55990.1 alpha-hydroxy-acid oxidizing protein [Kordiimonas sp. SCSIO 12610]